MGMPNFPIDEAYLIGDWLESFVWGVYTTVFAMTMHTIYHKRRDGVNKFVTATLVLLYLVATGHMAIALRRLIEGFILYRDVIDPVEYFANISIRLNMAKDYLYITSIFLGDIIIVWRLYVVYGRNLYIAALPTLMCFGELGVGYSSISQWLAPTQNFAVMDQLGTAMFALSLATNVIITSVIIGRIWYVTRYRRQAMGAAGGHHERVLMLLIESGALVAAAKITEFVLFELAPDDGIGLNAIDVIYEAMPQIIGLAPTCIVLAVYKAPKAVFTPPTCSLHQETTMFTMNGNDSEKRSLDKSSEAGSLV
ncbi:hypothetical protein C8Q77DRAFT_1160315 [Trametes polyzona]|nr:hypothetical protein C8Q77DRAFT_1160315 [Trametes polyzona]